jgi:tungstate transport system substrate-binding protein
VASERKGYALADRGTYLAFRDRAELVTLCAGDPALKNIYSFVDVSPSRHPHVNAKGASAFSDFLETDAARQVIVGLKKHGEALFQPLGPE